MTKASTMTGRLPAELANAVSDVIVGALKRGMEVDKAVCVVVAVAADYGCATYGQKYLRDLAEVVRQRTNKARPGPFS